MAYRDIDMINGNTIRKLISPAGDKKFGYLVGPRNSKNAIDIKLRTPYLNEAREFAREHPVVTVANTTVQVSL